MKKTECVKVVVRVRPMSSTEVQDQRKKIVDVDVSRGEVVIQNVKNDGDAERSFVFDQVFDHKAQQEQVYNNTALPIVENVMDGFNGTIFAYGQTGTGKTHTMEGRAEPPHERGIIPRTFDHVFRVIEGTPNIQFLVRVSYLELYNEEVRDLLSQNHLNKLELREKPDEGVYVKDLSRLIVSSVNDLNNQLKFGKNNRTVGQTKMNLESSRSHSIFCLTIESSEMSITNEQHIKVGKLNLVDLAGSERQSKTQAVGEMFKQAININQSLTTLGNVITALVDGKSQHIPYRDSKLTRLLQDSLGGNTKTVMVANVGPADYNYDETMQTLRYANRAKNIKNKPKINEDPKDAMIREYQEEINRLKDELSRKGGVGPGGKRITEQVIEVEDEDALNEIQQKAQKERAELQRQYNDTLKMTNVAEEEKKKLQQQLKEKMKMETNIKKEQEVMITKLKEMQQQILHGDKMKEQARQKEKELYKAKMELETREQEARRMAEELAKQEAAQVDVEQKFNNTKDEINAKTQKLNSLVSKIKDLKAQAQEQQQFRERQKEEILEDNRESLRQLSLMDFIIDHFISSDEVKKLQDKLEWSDEADDWIINEAEVNALKKPQSAFNHKRPLCNFAKMAISFGDPNPRFRPENILQLDLELPQRLTEDFTEEQSQKVQEVLNVALNDDEEDQAMIQNEKQANVYIEDPSVINKEAILNPPSNPQKARLQSANKRALAKRPGSGVKR